MALLSSMGLKILIRAQPENEVQPVYVIRANIKPEPAQPDNYSGLTRI